jgi:hypothetical protein
MNKVNRRKALKLAGLSGAALMAATRPAHAQTQQSKTNTEPIVPSKSSKESTGPRELFAVVDRHGKLTRGLHADSSRRLDVGVYEVIFSRDVRRGAYLATTGGVDFAGIPLAASASVNGRATNPRGVLVYTTNLSSDPIDCGFHLLVVCPEGFA